MGCCRAHRAPPPPTPNADRHMPPRLTRVPPSLPVLPSGFDPLSFSKGDLKSLKQKEIKNARLAMVAFLGALAPAALCLAAAPARPPLLPDAALVYIFSLSLSYMWHLGSLACLPEANCCGWTWRRPAQRRSPDPRSLLPHPPACLPAGFVAQHNAQEGSPLDQLAAHLKDPWGTHFITNGACGCGGVIGGQTFFCLAVVG
jgi:hypothetical protein